MSPPGLEDHDSPLAGSVLLAFLILLVSVNLLNVWGWGDDALGLDFYQFWAVGQFTRTQAVDNLYSAETRARMAEEIARRAPTGEEQTKHRRVAALRPVLETYSTPFLYVVLGVFKSADYERAFWLFRFVSLAIYVGSIAAACHVLRCRSWLTLLALAVLLNSFNPLISDLDVGNVNQIQLGLLVVALWILARGPGKSWDLAGGFVLGVAVAFKPNVAPAVLLVPIFRVGAKRYSEAARALAGVAAGAAGSIAVAGLSFGTFGCWLDWWRAIGLLPDSIIGIENGNFALSQLLTRLLGSDVVLPLAVVLTVAAAAYVYRLGSLARPLMGQASELPVIALGLLVYLLCGRLVWQHYYVLAVPAILVLLAPGVPAAQRLARVRALQSSGAAVAVLLLSVNPVAYLLRTTDPAHMTVMLVAGTVLLLALLVWRAEERPLQV